MPEESGTVCSQCLISLGQPQFTGFWDREEIPIHRAGCVLGSQPSLPVGATPMSVAQPLPQSLALSFELLYGLHMPGSFSLGQGGRTYIAQQPPLFGSWMYSQGQMVCLDSCSN